jgi:hypothetical protein
VLGLGKGHTRLSTPHWRLTATYRAGVGLVNLPNLVRCKVVAKRSSDNKDLEGSSEYVSPCTNKATQCGLNKDYHPIPMQTYSSRQFSDSYQLYINSSSYQNTMSVNAGWQCGACLTDFTQEDSRPQTFGGANYCIGCIAERIHFAINNATDAWPPLISGQQIVLTPALETQLPPDAVEAYRNAPAWRTIPIPSRIFCQHPSIVWGHEGEPCNGFAGIREEFVEGMLHLWQLCPLCARPVCQVCRRPQSE